MPKRKRKKPSRGPSDIREIRTRVILSRSMTRAQAKKAAERLVRKRIRQLEKSGMRVLRVKSITFGRR